MVLRPLLYTLVVVLGLTVPAFADHDEENTVGKVEIDKSGRIRRKVAPAEKITGINGNIRWVEAEDGEQKLVLITPSKKEYEIYSKDSKLIDLLGAYADKKRFHIEVSGVLFDSKEKHQIALKSIDSKNIDNDGHYVVRPEAGTSDAVQERLIEFFKSLPDTKITFRPANETSFSIQSDFSGKELTRQLRKAELDEYVRYIEPDTKVHAAE